MMEKQKRAEDLSIGDVVKAVQASYIQVVSCDPRFVACITTHRLPFLFSLL